MAAQPEIYRRFPADPADSGPNQGAQFNFQDVWHENNGPQSATRLPFALVGNIFFSAAIGFFGVELWCAVNDPKPVGSKADRRDIGAATCALAIAAVALCCKDRLPAYLY